LARQFIVMRSISFLSNAESVYGSDTVTRNKSLFFNGLQARYLGVTIPHLGGRVADHAHHLAQIEKLLGSHSLHGSESLCKLLRYLANQSLDHPGTSPKEYQIATEVFGRPKDFDPHLDSMVRVQAGRLRSKLAEYYASEGADDQILVEMPRGTYAVTFHDRPEGNGRGHVGAAHETASQAEGKSQTPRGWFSALAVLSVVLAAILAVATDRLLIRRTPEARPAGDGAAVPVALRVFWKGFLSGPQEPWIVFSNATTTPGLARFWRCMLWTRSSLNFTRVFA
jgi:hypothetical protein